eukprot:TRINITY_DN12250_c0_g3_i12.p2 TRINITY_DN12250_c0_g3~~TRINITY_DN12250_c0_g3_i12.p2  ORF type:complete len:113 (-),score=0.64 TRINITY_DN12250_c0_g3_i12:844-1182(-)
MIACMHVNAANAAAALASERNTECMLYCLIPTRASASAALRQCDMVPEQSNLVEYKVCVWIWMQGRQGASRPARHRAEAQCVYQIPSTRFTTVGWLKAVLVRPSNVQLNVSF